VNTKLENPRSKNTQLENPRARTHSWKTKGFEHEAGKPILPKTRSCKTQGPEHTAAKPKNIAIVRSHTFNSNIETNLVFIHTTGGNVVLMILEVICGQLSEFK